MVDRQIDSTQNRLVANVNVQVFNFENVCHLVNSRSGIVKKCVSGVFQGVLWLVASSSCRFGWLPVVVG